MTNQERKIIRRENRDAKWRSIMNADKGTKDARNGRLLNPYAGDCSFQPKQKSVPVKRLSLESAKAEVQNGAKYERGQYGQNLLVRNGRTIGSMTDTDARRLGLI